MFCSAFRSNLTRAPIVALLVASMGAAAAAAADGPLGLSADERWDQAVDSSVVYVPLVSAPTWVVPSRSLPAGVVVQPANNNVSVALYQGRLFMAWRTAPTHFASADARLYVMSSPDLGRTWRREAEFALGRDLREPFLLEIAGHLKLYFVELGDRAYDFEPRALWRSERLGEADWEAPVCWRAGREVAWDFKVRRGRAWMTSYTGKHYGVRDSPMDVSFRSSTDGVSWTSVGRGTVYRGGVSEAAFEFDRDGRLWAVTRNEDGDRTGFGSHVATASAEQPGNWLFPEHADPDRYDSPRLFRHGRDLYLVARRDLGEVAIGSRWTALPMMMRKLLLWSTYSLRPKRTALYRLDPVTHAVEHLLDLPSAGDTAFPSVARLGPHTFVIANYSSPLGDSELSWVR